MSQSLPKPLSHNPYKPLARRKHKPMNYTKNTYLTQKKLFQQTSETALQTLQKGNYVLIDLNTKSNFHTSKFPRLKTFTEDSRGLSLPGDRLMSQLSVDMDLIRMRKKRLSRIMEGVEGGSAETMQTAQAAQTIHTTQPASVGTSPVRATKPVRLAKTEDVRGMSECKRKVLTRQEQIINSGPPLQMLKYMLIRKFNQIREGLRD